MKKVKEDKEGGTGAWVKNGFKALVHKLSAVFNCEPSPGASVPKVEKSQEPGVRKVESTGKDENSGRGNDQSSNGGEEKEMGEVKDGVKGEEGKGEERKKEEVDEEPDTPWYQKKIGTKLNAAARELLEVYSGIPKEEVEGHVYRIRKHAWQIHPYPCIGQFRFLDLPLSQSPHYTQILSRLSLPPPNNQTFLDLGCCFGQEIRKLIKDGVPVENVYGVDIKDEFFRAGFELFGDGEKEDVKERFIKGDVWELKDGEKVKGAEDGGVDEESGKEVEVNGLRDLRGKIDILWAASFLHLFGLEDQIEICKLIVGLLREKKDSCVLGRQVGHLKAHEIVQRTSDKQKMYVHNDASFRQMWDIVGLATNSKWRVETLLMDTESKKGTDGAGPARWEDPDMRVLRFAVFRE